MVPERRKTIRSQAGRGNETTAALARRQPPPAPPAAAGTLRICHQILTPHGNLYHPLLTS
ncbi:hypothetical protein JYU34_017500 [Plutella xylostella]|uniref:Uncharacterized protein n=1 Tax=Plutella xylostella TaxID=51655 RepID=A0ABQ7Q2P3_PLUXY|nr:hypothetical protein JYU34_017500 [Plutella xylostella]